MRIKQNYTLRKMCGSSIVVSVSDTPEVFNGVVTLNESGELLWNTLYGGAEVDELVDVLVKEYGIDRATANADVLDFIKRVEGAGFLE